MAMVFGGDAFSWKINEPITVKQHAYQTRIDNLVGDIFDFLGLDIVRMHFNSECKCGKKNVRVLYFEYEKSFSKRDHCESCGSGYDIIRNAGPIYCM